MATHQDPVIAANRQEPSELAVLLAQTALLQNRALVHLNLIPMDCAADLARQLKANIAEILEYSVKYGFLREFATAEAEIAGIDLRAN